MVTTVNYLINVEKMHHFIVVTSLIKDESDGYDAFGQIRYVKSSPDKVKKFKDKVNGLKMKKK